MTVTTDRGIDHTPAGQQPSRVWIWVLVACCLVLVLIVAAVLLWPGEEALSDTPPWGLDLIQMPQTEEEVIAVLERLPEIEGRRPDFRRDEGMVVYDGTASEAPETYQAIAAFPGDAADVLPGELLGILEDMVAEAERSDSAVVEGSSLDADGDLAWVALNEESEGGTPVYRMAWAEPTGDRWIFVVVGGSAQLRMDLVHAFVRTAAD